VGTAAYARAWDRTAKVKIARRRAATEDTLTLLTSCGHSEVSPAGWPTSGTVDELVLSGKHGHRRGCRVRDLFLRN
jgi:hypothetical protein